MKQDRLRRKWDRLSGPEIRALQSRKLQRFIRDEVAPFSSYYRRVFEEAGIAGSDIKGTEDLPLIPFSSKKDLLSPPGEPERAREFILMPDEEVLKRRPSVMWNALLHGRAEARKALSREYRPVFLTSTSGRSAEPVPFFYTRHDIDNMYSSGERLVPIMGSTREDRLLNMFPYAPHLAFWQTHYAVTSYGSFTVSTGGGKVMGTDGNIRLVKKIKPTGLIGMPTFIYHLLHQAKEEGVQCEQLETLVLGGEKVPDGMRRKLRELAAQLGATDVRVVATYGFTEAKMAWGECPVAPGEAPSGYHLYPDLGLFEIIDPETGAVQPEGSPGELVFTPLDARGSVVLRYRTGDFIDGGLVYEPCPHCGRSMPRLVGAISRQAQMKEMQLGKLKGTLIDFNELEHVLDDEERVGSWQIELRKTKDDPHDLDQLILHVVRTGSEDEAAVTDHLRELFGRSFELHPNLILFHTDESMRERLGISSELKPRRVADHRARADYTPPPRTWDENTEGSSQ